MDTPKISTKNRIKKKRSNSIRFTFGATGGLHPFAIDCTLDGMPVGCATFTNLAAGQYTFSVAAVDNAGNQDPNPPVFRWTINAVIPSQSIEQLIQLKHSMHLDFATDRILDAQLNAALQFRQHNLKSGACGHLNGSVIQVQAELQVGHVTQTQGF